MSDLSSLLEGVCAKADVSGRNARGCWRYVPFDPGKLNGQVDICNLRIHIHNVTQCYRINFRGKCFVYTSLNYIHTTSSSKGTDYRIRAFLVRKLWKIHHWISWALVHGKCPKNDQERSSIKLCSIKKGGFPDSLNLCNSFDFKCQAVAFGQ